MQLEEKHNWGEKRTSLWGKGKFPFAPSAFFFSSDLLIVE